MSKKAKILIAICSALTLVTAMAVPAFASSNTNTVTSSTIMDILTAVTNQFSVANIVAMIAGILGVTVVFVFLWWGVRKGFRAIVAATTKGKPKI